MTTPSCDPPIALDAVPGSVASRRVIGVFLGIALVIGLTIEWTPANEFLMARAALATAGTASGVPAVMLGALAGAAVAFTIQLLNGTLALAAVSRLPRIAQWASRRSSRAVGDAEPGGNLVTDFMLAMAAGCAAVVGLSLVRSTYHVTRGYIVKLAGLAALGSGVIAGVALAGVEILGANHRAAADRIVQLLENPFAWVGLFVAVTVIGQLYRWLSGSRRSPDDQVAPHSSQ